MTTIGFIGGTGDLGQALAMHLAQDYDEVLLGSREKQKAEEAVKKLTTEKSGREYLKDKLKPKTNKEVVESSDIILATLPAKHAVQEVKELIGHFRGNQLLISTAAPTPKVGEDFLPMLGDQDNDDGSSSSVTNSIAKQIKRELVLKSIEVGDAFQTVPAEALSKEERIEGDVPVSCDNKETYEKIAKVINNIEGLRPVYLGSLEVSGMLEGMTSVLLNVGAHNHIKNATIKFTKPSG
jgi:8-hydroxy-5-deazaflavin:NADPH oxidoreductase